MFRPVKPSKREFCGAPQYSGSWGVRGGFGFFQRKTEFWRLDENVAMDFCIFAISLSVGQSAECGTCACVCERFTGSETPAANVLSQRHALGLAQFDLGPPHNEIDPGICAGNAGQYGGVNAPCSMFARYMLSGMLEVRPFGQTQLRRFMVFGAPSFLFGKTIPQTLYTWSPDAIGIEHSWGVGIFIAKGFEFRVTQHFLFDR